MVRWLVLICLADNIFTHQTASKLLFVHYPPCVQLDRSVAVRRRIHFNSALHPANQVSWLLLRHRYFSQGQVISSQVRAADTSQLWSQENRNNMENEKKEAQVNVNAPTLTSSTTAKKGTKNTEKKTAKVVKAQRAIDRVVQDQRTEYFGFLSAQKFNSCYVENHTDPATANRLHKHWAEVGELNDVFLSKLQEEQKEEHRKQLVWIRGHLQDKRGKGNLCFMIMRNGTRTIQVVLDAQSFVEGIDQPLLYESFVSIYVDGIARKETEHVNLLSQAERKNMVKWAGNIPNESVIDILADIRQPDVPITGTTQQVEIHAVKIFVISNALSELPFQLKDACTPELDQISEGAETRQSSKEEDRPPLLRVQQDVKLDNRVLDLRTPANKAIFRVSSKVCKLFREYLDKRKFEEIHTPKIIGGSSEGGSNVFQLKYFGKDASLAQSPQLYKEMAIASGEDRVYEIGPVFRAENSNTHRHLSEFTGLDVEMTFKDDFMEVVQFIDGMFQHIFKGLNSECAHEIATISTQYPHSPFCWLPRKTPIMTFEEGVRMLREDGNVSNIPEDLSDYDLCTEHEKLLGKLVKQKLHTDFFVLTHFPANVRAFYSMPTTRQNGEETSKNRLETCNSYDFFMRGEEILSGAQRVLEPAILLERMAKVGIKPESIQYYLDAFSLGCPPHAGCGIGLERVVMLFLGLNNIRKTSWFPRDPKRLSP